MHAHTRFIRRVLLLLFGVSALPAYVFAPQACLVPVEARKGYWIPLELALQMVGSCLAGAEAEPRSSANVSQCFNC